jgi:prepilin peptidase CpaA
MRDWIGFATNVTTIITILALLAAATHDLMARTVPNGLALILALNGVAARALDGTLLWGLVAGTLVFTLCVVIWWRGWMGGGDVKLLGAGAIAIAPSLVPPFLTAMSIAGAALALVYLAGRRFPLPVSPSRPASLLARVARVERRRLSRGGPLPYACAIAAGGLFVLV